MPGPIPRQAFVRRTLLGVAGAALLGSCRSVVPPADSKPADSKPADWTDLANQLSGRLTLPSNADFAAAKSVFNTRFANSTPAAVLAATSVDDIQRAMAFAAAHQIGISVRGGGHSYIGASSLDGTLVLDLRRLPGQAPGGATPGQVTVTPASDLDSVQAGLASHGTSIPSGSCPTVGVAGLTLGGGLGSDARLHGLTCDALISASVVLPSGEVVTASADEHGDLFWALRGGGGGNLGVVTSLTLQTFPATDRDVVTLVFPMESAAAVLTGWQDWMQGADRHVWGMVNITVGGGPGHCTVILATPPRGGAAVTRQLLSAAGLQASSTRVQTLSRIDFLHYFEGGAAARVPRAFVAGSDIIGEMTPAAADSIVTAMSSWPQSAGSATAVVESLSGAVRDVDPTGSAFPWRRQAASVQWYTEAAYQPASTWLSAAHQAVASASVGGYLNYPEPDLPLQRYLGPNTRRFNIIDQNYDPAGVMRSGIAH